LIETDLKKDLELLVCLGLFRLQVYHRRCCSELELLVFHCLCLQNYHRRCPFDLEKVLEVFRFRCLSRLQVYHRCCSPELEKVLDLLGFHCPGLCCLQKCHRRCYPDLVDTYGDCFHFVFLWSYVQMFHSHNLKMKNEILGTRYCFCCCTSLRQQSQQQCRIKISRIKVLRLSC